MSVICDAFPGGRSTRPAPFRADLANRIVDDLLDLVRGNVGIGRVNLADGLFEAQFAAAVVRLEGAPRHRADKISVFLKSSPLKRRGSPVTFASA